MWVVQKELPSWLLEEIKKKKVGAEMEGEKVVQQQRGGGQEHVKELLSDLDTDEEDDDREVRAVGGNIIYNMVFHERGCGIHLQLLSLFRYMIIDGER